MISLPVGEKSGEGANLIVYLLRFKGTANMQILSSPSNSVIFLLSFLLIFLMVINISAGEENQEQLLKKLLTLKGEERASKIKENKDKLNENFIDEILRETNEYCNNREAIPECKEFMELALEISLFIEDKKSHGKILLFNTVIDILERKGKDLSDLNKALELFKETGDLKGQASCYILHGIILQAWNNHEESLSYFNKGLEIYEKREDRIGEINSLIRIADLYSSKDEEEALEAYNMALAICEKNEYFLKKIPVHQLMAGIFLKQGRFEEALSHLDICEHLLSSVKEEKRDEIYYPEKFETERYYDRLYLLINNCSEYGRLYSQRGKYEEALKYYQKELELAGTSKYRSEEIKALWNTGITYGKIGKKENALKFFRMSLNIQSNEMEHSLKSVNYYFLGRYYLQEMNDLYSCLECYKEGIKYAEKIDLSILKDFLISMGLRFTGEAFLCNGDLSSAEKNLKESFLIYEKIQNYYTPKDDHIARIYMALGEVYRKKKDYDRAMSYYKKSLAITEEYYFTAARADCYEYMGVLYEEQGKYGKAIKHYEEALKINQKINNPDRIWKNFFSLGKLYQKEGKSQEAFNYYKSSLTVIETMRQEMKIGDFKKDFMKDKIEVYEKSIEFLAQIKDYNKAFNCSERCKGRVFLDLLNKNKVDKVHNMSSELVKKEKDLSEKIEIQNVRLGEEEQKPPKKQDKDLINLLSSELKKLKSDYEDLLDEIRIKDPEYLSLISVSPEKVEDIQKLLDEDTLLIEYFTGIEKTFLWTVTKDELHMFIIPVKQDELERQIKDYREEIAEHMTEEKIKSEQWRDMAKNLYSLLLKKSELSFSNKKNILIVPDGMLNYLPFHTLVDDKNRCFIENFNITFIPSGSILKYCKEKNTFSNNKLILFALGNLKIRGYSSLPFTVDEVKSIGKLYGEKECYMEKDMTLEKVIQNSGKGDIIHFATHGILDPETPFFSHLVLSDCDLELYKIFSLDLHAYLVTLSCCSTGLGKIVKGDELTGISRAFIYAGTPSVCVSLWDISDESTSILMERFYSYMKEGKDKSEALRLAELDVRKKFPHPFFWAPFILTGDWK
ncbi:MAG: CHAT domain-containing tetratricopeptide repeat protein [Candidatus Eremiobacterota bacterium]